MALPPWLNKLADTLGIQRGGASPAGNKPLPVRPGTPVIGTVILKPKDAPKPQGREITLKPRSELGRPAAPRPSVAPQAKQLTPAAMIYALAAGVLFALAIYNLSQGGIFNGIVTLLPAGGLALLAYKYIQ